MNFKKLAILIEMLSVTCLVSVGFSSWLVTNPTNHRIVGNIETYDIINSNAYISISNMIMSDYTESGFYTDFIYSDGVSKTCKVEFDVIMNYNKYMTDIHGTNKNTWGNSRDFEFEIELGYKENVAVKNLTNREWTFFDIIGRSSNSSIKGKYGYDNTPSSLLSINGEMNNSVSNDDYSISNFDENPSYNCVFSVNDVPSSTKYINIKLEYYFEINDFNENTTAANDFLTLTDIGIPFLVNFIVVEG